MGYPCRFIPRNVFDLATITSTVTPYTTTPLVNLKNDRRARVCRWPSAATISLKGTWNGQGFQVGGVALDRFNLEPAATVRFRGFSAADWTGSTLVDTGTVAPYNAAALGSFTWGVDPLGAGVFDGYLGQKYWNAWFAKQTILSFQFDIIDTGNSWNYIEIGRAVLGDYIETGYNAVFGIEAGWNTKTTQDETDGGSIFSDGRLPRRAITGSLECLTETERRDMYDFTRYVEKRKVFLASFQAGEAGSMERDYTIPCAKFTDLPKIPWKAPTAHSMRFAIVEG